MYIILYVHATCISPFTPQGTFGVLPLIALVNNVVVNVGMQISLPYPALPSVNMCSDVGLLGHMGILGKAFQAASTPFSLPTTHFKSHHQSTVVQVSLVLVNTRCFLFLPSLWMWDEIPLWFWLAFLSWLVMSNTFHMLIGRLSMFLGELFIQVLCHLLIGFCCCCWTVGVPDIFWILNTR